MFDECTLRNRDRFRFIDCPDIYRTADRTCLVTVLGELLPHNVYDEKCIVMYPIVGGKQVLVKTDNFIVTVFGFVDCQDLVFLSNFKI